MNGRTTYVLTNKKPPYPVRSETYILGERRERTSRNRASSNILSPIRQREVTSATRNTSLPVKNKIRRALSL